MNSQAVFGVVAMCSRNGGAMAVAITAFPSVDPNVMVMILLAVPVPAITWFVIAKFFASRAGPPVEGATA